MQAELFLTATMASAEPTVINQCNPVLVVITRSDGIPLALELLLPAGRLAEEQRRGDLCFSCHRLFYRKKVVKPNLVPQLMQIIHRNIQCHESNV